MVVLSGVMTCLRAAVSVREGGFSQEDERGAGWPGLAETCPMVMRGNRKCN